MKLSMLPRTKPDLLLGRALPLIGRRTEAMNKRLRVLAEALEISGPAGVEADVTSALEQRLQAAEPDELWLTLAVLTASLPLETDVIRAVRQCRMDGPMAVLDKLTSASPFRGLFSGDLEPDVEVLTGQVLVDLEHTSRTELATGIQRVSRMAASRWSRDHDVVLVGWAQDQHVLRRLLPHEASRALTGTSGGFEPPVGRHRQTVAIPWCATYVLPELALERERTHRMLAMARFSRSRTAIVGHDCVPVSSAETTDVGVSEGYTNYLSAVRHMDQVAAVSGASAQEFRGWRHMLSAIGVRGPEIAPVSLPVEAPEPDETSLATARERLLIGSLPLVLCVGTHEPRKNHLAVLHAAEVLWRRGLRFSLAFIGGHSWNSQRFDARVDQLRGAGRPIELLQSVTDDQLWAAYRISRCVVFPSLNEGFGLPVAEALACGTPVVTSNFGSMAETAQHGGAVLVDPRDDSSLADGLARVLSDDALHARLRAEALARPHRSWDDYARETWDLLVAEGGTRP
jgi:glycosyltransferase involved in cell wall biosynthesis